MRSTSPSQRSWCKEITVLIERIAGFVNTSSRRRLGKLDVYTVSEYLRRVPTVSVLTSLIFIEKLTSSKEAVQLLTETTPTDLLIVAMMIASKYLYDIGTVDEVCNTKWAEQFSMEVRELNQLEVKFLWAINWRFYISSQDFTHFISSSGIFTEEAKKKNDEEKAVMQQPVLKSQERHRSSRCRLRPARRHRSAKLLALLTTTYLACISSHQTSLPASVYHPHPASVNRSSNNSILVETLACNTTTTTTTLQLSLPAAVVAATGQSLPSRHCRLVGGGTVLYNELGGNREGGLVARSSVCPPCPVVVCGVG